MITTATSISDHDGTEATETAPGAGAAEALQQLSHDIRSAMSDVLGGLRLVEPSRLDLQTQTQLERVRSAADTLAALVDDALMMAAGETETRHGPGELDLTTWLAALSGRWTGRAQERGSQFRIRRIGTLPKRVLASPISLERVVSNLVGNALVHVSGSDVVIEVLADREVGLTLCVSDDGPGFPSEVIRALADEGETRSMGRTGGTGLGLRIARALSEEMGAELIVTNDGITGGATAAVTLPPKLLDWTGEERQKQGLPNLSGLRILVAEDNLTNQTILRQMLVAMRASAVFVNDGLAAIEALEQDPFDIALIDIEMPQMDGLEVMRRIRATEGSLASLPVVAITAYVLRDNREAIYAAGADGIVGKPISSREEFGNAILRHVGRPTGLPEPEDIAAGRTSALGLQAKMDERRLDRLLDAAGPEGRSELLDRLCEDLGAVRDGLDAGVAAASIPEIRSQTHILIAISGAVGADRLCQVAEVLNIAAKRKRLESLERIYAPVRADLVDLITLIEGRRVALA